MDNSGIDPGIFEPLGIAPQEQLASLPDAATGQNGSSIAGPSQSPTASNFQPGFQPSQDTGNILDDILSNVPGVGELTKLLGVVKLVVGDIEHGIALAESSHPLNLVVKATASLGQAAGVLEIVGKNFWHWMDDVAIGTMFKQMLEQGLGVHTDQFTPEENEAVNTVDTMLGFSVMLQFIILAVETIGKPLFANRWGEAFKDTLSKIPEEMGLSWALGMTIDESFKAAQGEILREAINKQKHPNRIAWPQIRLLLKQHVIEKDTYEELLNAQGFPQYQIDYLRELQDAQLPIGDISQLWYRDIIDDTDAKKRIAALGFSDDDTGKLFDMYVAKSENQASATYRTTARAMFAAHIITADMYRSALNVANYPSKLIDEDIAAVELEQKLGRVLHSATVIKQRYQHHTIDDAEATRELTELNYAPSYITELLEAWKLPPLRKTHGLSQAKLLSYLVSGIMTPEQVGPQLIALGLDDKSVEFLLAHPTANSGTRQHARTPGLVTQAYVDGVIQPSELRDAFKSANVKDSDLDWYVQIAQYKLAHKRGGQGGHIELDAAQIREAFKVGLIDFHHCVERLQHLGYSSEAAMVLTEITNKGPYYPPQPPAFASLGDAIEYMRENGFFVGNPPDPRLLAAEGMLAMNGYTWTKEGTFPSNPPSAFPPPPTLPPVPPSPLPPG